MSDSAPTPDQRPVEPWKCQHPTRCADSVCSYNPAIQRWIRGSK